MNFSPPFFLPSMFKTVAKLYYEVLLRLADIFRNK